jgi:hypothetical protein
MKLVALALIFTASSVFAMDFDTEKSKFDLNQKQKLELCQDLAYARFCGSEVDGARCLNDFEFSGRNKHLAGKPKLALKKSYKLKSKDHDFTFAKEENFNIFSSGEDLISIYTYESYEAKGKDSSSYVPSFILDSSCKGDGDKD